MTVPARCHPHAKVVFELMRQQNVTYDELEHCSGVLKSTIKAWRGDNRPGLETLEAAFGSLGWRYLPVPGVETIPPAIRASVEALAREWEGVDAVLCQLLSALVTDLPTPSKRSRPARFAPHCLRNAA